MPIALDIKWIDTFEKNAIAILVLHLLIYLNAS